MRHAMAYILLLITVLILSLRAEAGTCDSHCAHCGSMCPCRKICRLVCEEKKVEVMCWGCKCEDFCVPGPSCPDCECCEMVCTECEIPRKADGPYAKAKKFVWKTWIPGDATMYTRKKLMRASVTKTAPSYKWVVEDLCPQCVAQLKHTRVPAGTELPATPELAGSEIIGGIAAEPAETGTLRR